MRSKGAFALSNRVTATILVTGGWLVLMLGWIVFAWGRNSFFQSLMGLGIATLVFSALVGVMWVAERGFRLAATIVTTLGWMSFALYWVGFAWSQHTLLQSVAALALSFIVCVTIVSALLLGRRSYLTC